MSSTLINQTAVAILFNSIFHKTDTETLYYWCASDQALTL